MGAPNPSVGSVGFIKVGAPLEGSETTQRDGGHFRRALATLTHFPRPLPGADDAGPGALFNRDIRLQRARSGLRTGYAVADGAAPSPSVHRGFIDAALIRRVVPDFLDRTFYISGPWAMVSQFRRVLKEMGVARSRIKVDFFPGFA